MRPAAYGAAAVLLAGCFMPAATVNRAQERFNSDRQREIRLMIDTARAVMDRHGLRPVGEPATGWVEQRYDESDEVRVALVAGQRYLVVSFCDARCTDSDLTVYDPGNRRIGSDTRPDNAAQVEVVARVSGSYRAVVTAPGCPDRCMWGVAVYTPR